MRISDLATGPAFYQVAYARAEEGKVVISSRIGSLDLAREFALEGDRGGVVLAVYANGTVEAVEARHRDAETGLHETAVYETIFELSTMP